MFNKRLKNFLISFTFLSFSVVFSIFNASSEDYTGYTHYQKIDLRSCNVSISADKSYPDKNGITYSGNVRVLLGLANLRIDKVTLVKKQDGTCKLIAGRRK